jgi:hypothetical protein
MLVVHRACVLAFVGGCASAPAHPVIAARALERPAPARPASFSVGTHVPDLGCFAIAASRSLVACVVGTEGHDMGFDTRITVAFASLTAGVEVPDAITVLDSDETIYYAHAMPLEDKARTAIEHALDGFVAWLPATTLPAPARIAVGGAEVVLTRVRRSPGGDNAPPTFDARLEVHVLAQIVVLDEVKDAPLDRYDVRVFQAGGAIVIERTETQASEGAYGREVSAWVCRVAACTPID